jgi:hypothetical protein
MLRLITLVSALIKGKAVLERRTDDVTASGQ